MLVWPIPHDASKIIQYPFLSSGKCICLGDLIFKVVKFLGEDGSLTLDFARLSEISLVFPKSAVISLRVR